MAFALQRVRAVSLKGLAQSFLPAPFLGLPQGMSTDVEPCPWFNRSHAHVLQPSYLRSNILHHGLRGLVLSQTPRRLGPRSRRLLLWASPHTERPRCLASAATALLFLLPPHM